MKRTSSINSNKGFAPETKRCREASPETSMECGSLSMGEVINWAKKTIQVQGDNNIGNARVLASYDLFEESTSCVTGGCSPHPSTSSQLDEFDREIMKTFALDMKRINSLINDPRVRQEYAAIQCSDQYGAGTQTWVLDNLAEVSWSTRRVRRRGNFVNIKVRDLTFAHLEHMHEPVDVTLPRLLDQFMDQCLAESGVSTPETKYFCMTITHPSLDKGSIFCPFRQRQSFCGVALLNLISKVQQSKRDILLNDQLHVEMEIYDEIATEDDLMEGGRNGHIFLDTELGIRGSIQNTDTKCLAKAVAIGMLNSEFELEEDPEEKRRIQRRRMNYVSRWRPALHDTILRTAGLPLDKVNYNLNDLKAIAEAHPAYRIILYTRPAGHRMYSIHSTLNSNATQHMNIGFHNNHYDIVHPSVEMGFFSAVICRYCHQSFATRERDHRCINKCSRCMKPKCNGSFPQPNGFSIECSACNITFYSAECHEQHKKKMCRTVKLCKLCNMKYAEKQDRTHICGHVFCSNCGKVQPKEHKCCWPIPTPKQRENAVKNQEKYKFVFYDFETVVLEDGLDVKHYAEEQWPNLVAYRRFCNTCIDETDCESCQQKVGHFRYEDNDGKWALTDRFVDWLLTDPTNMDATFIAHNGSRFDSHFILNRLLARGVYPSLIMNGSQILSMSIEPLKEQNFNKVTFKDSYLLVPLPLAALPKAFGIPDISKGEFPYLFNHPRNYHKILPGLPERKYFCIERKKDAALQAFNQWYNDEAANAYNFDAEILSYCEMDVKILTECMIKYMKLATELTGWNPLVQCITFASFSLYQLKMNHMKADQVGILLENGYMQHQRQSKLALKYIRWLESNLNYDLQHKLNGGEKVVNFRGRKFNLDAFDARENTAYEINGCYYHGCPTCTDPTAKGPGETRNTMLDLYNATKKREALLIESGIAVKTVWEHEIYNEMTQNREMRNFMAGCKVVTRLRPRDAFLGGRTQTYRLYAEASEHTKLEYYDFVSLYPYVTAFVAEYPVGGPTVITTDFDSFENNCPYKGLVKCDILPPRSLRYPVIGARIGQKLIFTNCRSCAEAMKNVQCQHEEEADRLLHTTITHVELQCAIERGYKVLKTYEVWHWDEWEQGGLFKNFVKQYIKIKQEASGWPKENMTEAEKDLFLSEHLSNVGVALDASKIAKNPAMRSIAKLQLNSVWGKMGQRSDKPKTEIFANNDKRLGLIIADTSREVTAFKTAGDSVYLSSKPKDEYIAPASYTNVAIAAYTTAHARLLLYKAMERVGDKLVYTDTDSLIFLRDTREPHPLADMCGEWLGKLTSEIPEGWEMKKFVSPAAKVYSYTLENGQGQQQVVTKAKGVTLDNTAANIVNFIGLERLVKKLVLDNDEDELMVQTTLIRRDLGHIRTVDMNKRTRVVMDKLRYLPDFSTLPYGYKL